MSATEVVGGGLTIRRENRLGLGLEKRSSITPALPLDPPTRTRLRALVDERRRQLAFDGVCPFCLTEMPEKRHPLAIYCSRACSNNAYAERRRIQLRQTV